MSDTDRDNPIRTRLFAVRERIAAAAVAAGRDPAAVTLVAVSKTQPPEAVLAVARAGQAVFGENRIEEAGPKMRELDGEAGLEWHMIGHIQSRKARAAAAGGFALLHSVDSIKLAERLGSLSDGNGRRQAVLLEMNVSGEASKAGFAAADRGDWPRLMQSLKPLAEMPGLELRGLMTMAPQVPEPRLARPYFDRLRQLRDYLAEHLPMAPNPELSMGMTDDFEEAVRAGATLVRIGRAIFGERN